ncbi:MAG: LamG domain-containing protein [Limisphaerales bacterium]
MQNYSVETPMKTTRALFGILASTIALAVQGHTQSFLTNGLVAYYPFAGNANDASGNGNNGFAENTYSTTNQFGQVNSALGFTGNSWVYVPYSSSLFTMDYTVSLMFNCKTELNKIQIISSGNARPDIFDHQSWSLAQGIEVMESKITGDASLDGWRGYSIGSRDSEQNFGFSDFNGIADRNNYDSGKCVTPIQNWRQNQWYNLTFTRSGTTAQLYLNGILIASATNTKEYAPAQHSPLYIGSYAHYPTTSDPSAIPRDGFFVGIIYDVRLYNRGLSGDEVQQLYIQESGGEAHVKEVQAKAEAQAKEAQAKADAQAKEAQAQAEMQAKAEARAEQIRNIKTAGFVVVSLAVFAFVFIKFKKTSDADRSKKVSDLSAKLSRLKAEMDRETKAFEDWSNSQPEAWKKIKASLVDSYLASDHGKQLLEFNMYGMWMHLWMECVKNEQFFLPPSARPSDEQWHSALNSKIEPEVELARQRLAKIRDILLTRLAPDYDTQQCEITDLEEKFIELDLEKPDAPLEKPLSDEEVNKMMSSLTELIKTIGPLENLALIKKDYEEQLEYLRSATSTGTPVLPSRLKKITEKYKGRYRSKIVEIDEQIRFLKASHPDKFV